jgi:RNA polymerase sigma-70 factor (ECF subfamily)
MAEPTNSRDTELAERCRSGDEGAWRELYGRFRAIMLWRIQRIVPARLREDSEDVLQEAFLKVLANLSKFDPARGTISAFIATVTVNVTLDYLRRQRVRLKTLPLDAEWEAVAVDSVATGNVERAVDHVKRQIGNLAEGPRRQIALALLDGMEPAEVVALHNVSPATVYRERQRCVELMREELEKFSAGKL